MSGIHEALPPKVSWPWMLGAIGVWLVASLIPAAAPMMAAPGAFEGEVLLVSDVFDGPFGPWAIGETPEGRVLVELNTLEYERGDRLSGEGTLGGEPGTAAGRVYGAVLSLREVTAHRPSRFLPHRAGSVIRRAVVDGLTPMDDGRALLAGFLIGETTSISEVDQDAMRKSGLAHFVAVSGSNVALYLALLAVVAGPLALGPKRRALVGLLGLPVYAAATRFEPSVMRASVMAALALAGRLAGIVLEAWQLLSLAVVILLLTDPALTTNVGFQLSVAATAGVLIGARWPVRGPVVRALTVTLGAQLAVAPLLLIHFGTVPLLSPFVNLVAAPLVAASTLIGAIGVGGVGFLVPLAAMLADAVLAISRGAAAWPQLGPTEVGLLLALGVLLLVMPRARLVAPPVAALGLAFVLIGPAATLTPGSVVVLDVGQGDSILIHGGDQRFALIDGGPDAAVLVDKLRRYGVRQLELVVVTHVHADHVTGLIGILGHIPIRRLWVDADPHSSPAFEELSASVRAASIVTLAPEPGHRIRLGAVDIAVDGPLRTYASPNDQSIVITVTGSARSMLLAGDIEIHAQRELSELRADVLKVPHQGAGTSDVTWLQNVKADIAVISVGPNQFGHPVPWVIDALEESGTRVIRTDHAGDVVVELGTLRESSS